MTWNRVVTADVFWDIPRGGIAFYGDRLVAYRNLWDEAADDYADCYALAPVDPALLPLIEERWAIWIRWSDARVRGDAPPETHPALPDDRQRYDTLCGIIGPQIEIDEKCCLRRRAEFRWIGRGWNGYEVRWSPCL
ncbi:hypothetical protein [Zavarzinia sp.]|uniref:hypothetical protein n=1 Tax=Zavarzinia sp. TaxID=2027920 RepID=UPI00356A97B2